MATCQTQDDERLSHPSRAAMPNKDNKSGPQNAAEAEVEGFKDDWAHSLPPLKRHGCRWCSRTPKNRTIQSFSPTTAFLV
jgi:hypothetical protein